MLRPRLCIVALVDGGLNVSHGQSYIKSYKTSRFISFFLHYGCYFMNIQTSVLNLDLFSWLILHTLSTYLGMFRYYKITGPSLAEWGPWGPLILRIWGPEALDTNNIGAP